MVAAESRLRAYAPRTLSMLAGVVHGAPCDVQLTDDLRAVATVVCRDRQLLFDPDRATLGFCGAHSVAPRPRRSRSPPPRSRAQCVAE